MRPMSWITSAAAVLTIATTALALPARAGARPPGLYPTSAETRAEFEAVCHRLAESSDPYFGRRVVERLESRLAEEKPGAADPETRVGLRGRLGEELLRIGEPERAAELLEEARAIAVRHALGRPVRSRLSYLLGLAHLQLAEDRNCLAMQHPRPAHGSPQTHRHRPASCILPFAGDALHRLPEPARAAAEHFLDVLADRPDDLQARWLLNLVRMVSGDYPGGVPEELRLPPDALRSEAPFTPWKDRAGDLGVDVFDLAGGALVDDFDGDGLLDLVTSTWDLCEPLTAFRNTGPRDGGGGFVDVTEAWGLDGQLGGINLVQADYDGDGQLDILVLRGGWMGGNGRIRNSLLRNELRGEAGRFVDVTAAAGLAYPAYPTQTAAWADVDGDGDLDLYVGNEAASDQVYSWSLVENPGRPFPSQLFLNRSERSDASLDERSPVAFTDVARAAGVTNLRFAKSVAWGDYDDDGDPDLYVSNFGANRLYRNDGGGGRPLAFTDVAAELGVTAPEAASFSSWFFDYDNDGDLDLFVSAYGAPIHRVSAAYLGLGEAGEDGHPLLYRNDGGVFRDVSLEAGFRRPLLPMGANYGDLDNDGWLDVVLGTGVPNLEALMPDAVYRNAAGRFVDVTFASGLAHLQKGHGVAFGDLDNDGDQDLLHQMGGAYPSEGFVNALYENPTVGARWLTVRLEGRRANRFGVGGRLEVAVDGGGGRRSIHLLVGSGGSFGGSSLQQEIGLGDAREILRLTVRWPGSGTVQHFDSLTLDRAYLAVEGEPELVALDLPRFTFGG